MLRFYIVAAIAVGVMMWYGMSAYRQPQLVVTYPTSTLQTFGE